jgi:hypothetical protein
MFMKWLAVCPVVRLLKCRIAKWILMKFSVVVIPFKDVLYTYFVVPTMGNTNMVDERTCDVEATIGPLI